MKGEMNKKKKQKKNNKTQSQAKHRDRESKQMTSTFNESIAFEAHKNGFREICLFLFSSIPSNVCQSEKVLSYKLFLFKYSFLLFYCLILVYNL